jgi:hypothetical protein
MKSNVAVALSVAGVLAAGTAAALVNTQVLSGSESAPASAAAAEIVLPTTTLPGAPVVVGDATSTTAASPAAAPTSTAGASSTFGGKAQPTAAATGTQAVYEIGTSGTVTLDSAGGVLRVVAIEPAAGWAVRANEQRSDQRIHVTFASGSIEVDFDADLVLGVVGTSVASRDLSAPATTLPSSSSGGDDHDDDRDEAEYEDDDRDDDRDDDGDDDDRDDDDDHDEYEDEDDD